MQASYAFRKFRHVFSLNSFSNQFTAVIPTLRKRIWDITNRFFSTKLPTKPWSSIKKTNEGNFILMNNIFLKGMDTKAAIWTFGCREHIRFALLPSSRVHGVQWPYMSIIIIFQCNLAFVIRFKLRSW